MKKLVAGCLLLLCLLLSASAFAEESRYDFDAQDAKLSSTIYLIAQRAGKEVVINEKLEGTVLTSLRDKTVTEAMDTLAKAFNFNWMMDGNVIVVSPADTMLQNKRYIMRYANPKFVKDELVSMGISDKSISVNVQYNALSVSGTPYTIHMADQRITELDVPVLQCLIVGQFIEISKSDSKQLGLQFTTPSYDHSTDGTTSGSSGSGNWASKLKYSIISSANRAFADGHVLTRPSILTENGQEAELVMGDQVPILSSTSTTASTDITVTYKDVGNKLKVVPVINDVDKSIYLNVDTEVSSIAKWITSGVVKAPQISTRRAKTAARIKAGETLIIGGLMTNSDIDNLSGIPGLMDLPILGKLFQYHDHSKDNSEVYILLTPYIIDANTNVETLLKTQK